MTERDAMKTDYVNGGTRLYSIIGDPVSSVRTPTLFNAMFVKNNVNAVLVPLLVPKSQLKTAWEGIKSIGNLDGIVVTMPHKVEMCGLVDELGESARIVGAVNTIRRNPDGRWEGDIFDGIGCVHGIKTQNEGCEVAGRSAFLLGLGGAGAAIAAALAQSGIRRLVVSDLDEARVRYIVDRIHTAYPETRIEIGTLKEGPYDIAINATPLGMREGDALPFDPGMLPETTLIVDVVPNPEFTPFLNLAKESGHAIRTGRHMHWGQAISAAKFWGFSLD